MNIRQAVKLCNYSHLIDALYKNTHIKLIGEPTSNVSVRFHALTNVTSPHCVHVLQWPAEPLVYLKHTREEALNSTIVG